MLLTWRVAPKNSKEMQGNMRNAPCKSGVAVPSRSFYCWNAQPLRRCGINYTEIGTSSRNNECGYRFMVLHVRKRHTGNVKGSSFCECRQPFLYWHGRVMCCHHTCRESTQTSRICPPQCCFGCRTARAGPNCSIATRKSWSVHCNARSSSCRMVTTVNIPIIHDLNVVEVCWLVSFRVQGKCSRTVRCYVCASDSLPLIHKSRQWAQEPFKSCRICKIILFWFEGVELPKIIVVFMHSCRVWLHNSKHKKEEDIAKEREIERGTERRRSNEGRREAGGEGEEMCVCVALFLLVWQGASERERAFCEYEMCVKERVVEKKKTSAVFRIMRTPLTSFSWQKLTCPAVVEALSTQTSNLITYVRFTTVSRVWKISLESPISGGSPVAARSDASATSRTP